ncbi:MAG: 4Fe-4S dicluster domain-containing protein, partial [Methanomicrobiales archaeon]|nr:4Fe-4S dicluster domain-containing protein [Methanomicrobiales archaeon]
MSSCEQVTQNLGYAEQGMPDSLTEEELSLIGEVREELQKGIQIPCTGCRYCTPCQEHVNIPECFELYNQAHMYESKDTTAQMYEFFLGGFLTGFPGYASGCRECGECEEKCPQGLPVRENLKKVARYFGK